MLISVEVQKLFLSNVVNKIHSEADIELIKAEVDESFSMDQNRLEISISDWLMYNKTNNLHLVVSSLITTPPPPPTQMS